MSVTSKEVINDENSTGNDENEYLSNVAILPTVPTIQAVAKYADKMYTVLMRLPGGGHKRFPHLLPSLKPRDSLRGGDSSFEQEMEVRSSLRHLQILDIATSRRLIVSRSILR